MEFLFVFTHKNVLMQLCNIRIISELLKMTDFLLMANLMTFKLIDCMDVTYVWRIESFDDI